jgi:phytoene synthase
MLDPLAALVRRHDPDRFLTALFAPEDRRPALFALYAFNHELARAREVASEPMLALIRLQWWREVVQGAERRHEVATPLSQAIAAGALDRGDLLALVAARETEAEPSIPTLDAWRDFLLAGAGGLAVAAGRLLGATEPERLRPLGAAYGVAGMLRSVGALAAQRRCLLPADVLAAHGLVPEGVALNPADPALQPALRALATEGLRLLDQTGGVRLARAAIAAALPAVLARRDLRRGIPVPGPRGFGDRLAVTLAGLSGRL